MIPKLPVTLLTICALALSHAAAIAGNPVTLDVPAILPCHVDDAEPAAAEAATDFHVVRVDLPVSLLLRDSPGLTLDELLIAVYWSEGANLVHDFQPKTTLGSDIEGTVKIQKTRDKNGSLNIDSSGGYGHVVGINGRMQLGSSKGDSTSYEQKPEQSLLVASGFIKRGTGVYFKFRASTQTTLEGTRELSVQFNVPTSWRAGLIRVDCQVTGRQAGFTGGDAKLVQRAEFISALHLANDRDAYARAAEYVRQEHRLLGLHQQSQPKKQGLIEKLGAWIDDDESLPDDWFRRVVYSSSENSYRELRRQLPAAIERATTEFVIARRNLTRLNR